MARIRPQTLLPRLSLPIKFPPLSFHHRHLSSKPQLIEIDLASSEEEMIQRLDDMVHRVMLQKSTPDWLPFLPGSSFWVPPPTTATQLFQTLPYFLTHEESLSLTTSRGWPCSAFFIPDSAPQNTNLGLKLLDGGMEVMVKIQAEEEIEGESKMHDLEDSGSEEQEG